MASWISAFISIGCYAFATNIIYQSENNSPAYLVAGVGLAGLVSTVYCSIKGEQNYGKAVREYNRYLSTTYK